MNGNELTRQQLTNIAVSYLGLKSKNRLYPSTTEGIFHCPFHKDKTPSMGIDFTRGIYHCFSCGRSGNIESLYKEMTGISLYKELGIKNDPFSVFSRKDLSVYEYDDTPQKKDVFVNFDESKMTDALKNRECRAYLDRRGISYDTAKSVGMMYSDDSRINTTLFRHRLCIPVYENGRLTSIEGRRLSDEDTGPKVLYPKNTSVDLLYDIDNLDKNDDVFAVEGLIDLFVLRQCHTFDNSTSIFGANVTRRQLSQISEFKRFIYIPDNDEAGDKTVESLRNSGLDNIYILKLPKNIDSYEIKDVGDLPKIGVDVESLVKRRWLRYIRKLD